MNSGKDQKLLLAVKIAKNSIWCRYTRSSGLLLGLTPSLLGYTMSSASLQNSNFFTKLFVIYITHKMTSTNLHTKLDSYNFVGVGFYNGDVR
jgi:hypothetical protein